MENNKNAGGEGLFRRHLLLNISLVNMATG